MNRFYIRGFTLIELMIVLVIAVILLAIGVPSFRTLIQNQRLTTTVNDFSAAIRLTRSEALQRGVQVAMVPADATGTDWTQGWMVFVDDNNDGKLSTGEILVFRHDPVATGLGITHNIPAPPFIGFSAMGNVRMATNQKGGTVSFTLDNQARRIKLNFLGRTRVCDPVKQPTTCTVTTTD